MKGVTCIFESDGSKSYLATASIQGRRTELGEQLPSGSGASTDVYAGVESRTLG